MKSGRMMKKEGGGPVMEKEPGKVPADKRTDAMVAREKMGQKRGGSVKGAAAKSRPDKRARGGRMTPKSPFSGADGPGLGYEGHYSGNDMGGKGKEPHPC